MKEHFESYFARATPRFLDGTLFRNRICEILASESLSLLDDEFISSSSQYQILFCTGREFQNSLQQGLRPLKRYFFISEEQTLDDFNLLLHQISSAAFGSTSGVSRLKALPSMQNSLEVLRQLAAHQLGELKDFTQKDDLRRKNFKSLIQLARALSMSQDLEEVAQAFWRDLRHTEGITGLSILVIHPNSRFLRIQQKGGKFHLEKIAEKADDLLLAEAELLKILELDSSLESPQSFEKVLKPFFKKIFINPQVCPIPSDSSGRTYFLIFETDLNWTKPSAFKIYLKERLPFIQFTLEKCLLQEEVHSKTQLWIETFEKLQDPIAILNHEGQALRANPLFQNSLQGEKLLDLHNSQASSSIELEVKNHIFQSRLFPIIHGESEKPRNFIAHVVDVTRERLLYSKALQAEKMSALSRLSGDLSKALNTPLTQIRDLTHSVLDQHALNLMTRNDLTEIVKAAERSLRLIDDFTHFSKGQMTKEFLWAETVVEKTIPLVKALLHGLRFHVQLNEVRHPIHASLSLLQQVLYNLLRNAHQAMEGKGELLIQTTPRNWETTPGVEISVIDSGPGVPVELHATLFQPFVSTKSEDKGSGLGLNVVKQIVESHHGHVGFENQQQGGSKFWIWIPTVKDVL